MKVLILTDGQYSDLCEIAKRGRDDIAEYLPFVTDREELEELTRLYEYADYDRVVQRPLDCLPVNPPQGYTISQDDDGWYWSDQTDAEGTKKSHGTESEALAAAWYDELKWQKEY